MSFMLRPIVRAHAEAMVEHALAGTGDVNQSAIKHDPIMLIGIQAFMQEVMNHPARLRDAKHAGFFDRAREWI